LYEIRNFEKENQKVSSISLTIQISAVTIAISAILLGIPSVEIITLSIFMAGYLYRFRFASELMMAIVLTWEIVATITFGFSGYAFPFKILGWTFILLAGRLSWRIGINSPIEFATVGAFVTLIWDIILLFSVPFTVGLTGGFIPLLISSFIFGIPFTFIHVVSNALLFSLLPKIIASIRTPLEKDYSNLLLGSENK